jgi:hypothetical protein
MNNKETNMTNNRIVRGSFAVAATAGLVVVSRIVGAFLPLEVLTALVTVAALAGYAALEILRGAPRGIDNGLNRRFRKDFVKEQPSVAQVLPMWRNDERKAA